MKKLLTLLLACLMLTAYAIAETNQTMDMPLLGGWKAAEDFTLTEDKLALFEKGTEKLVGVKYTPVAYLGSQVVAGTNHCFLSQAVVVVPDESPSYVLMTLYENLQGDVTLLSITELGMQEKELLAGGWRAAESFTLTEDILALFEKGTQELVGVVYTPVAYLGSQVVAGMNHCILCQATVVVPDASPSYVLMVLYQDLAGQVSLLKVENLTWPTAT